jgi:diguanylate cyclase (GGDEF)-like protein
MNKLVAMYISLRESLGIHTPDQFHELVTDQDHGGPISRHRAALLQSRVYFFCVVFAILVPVWSLIDLAFLPGELWRELLLIRLLSSAAFAVLALQARKTPSLKRARLLLAGMLAVTPVFYLFSEHWMGAYELTGAGLAVAELYTLLPFVMVAGLTLFPLTLREFILYALPMLIVTLVVAYPQTDAEIPQAVSTVWLFILILGIAMFSALKQLRYMLSQVSRASYDALTGLLTRRAGIEILELQFRLASMEDSPLSILYFDLDHFKSVNDTYGHDAGDVVLKEAAMRIGKSVRKGDSVVRWGGEEFIVVLPHAAPQEANDVVHRIMQGGLGQRPDGDPVTASIGVAETQEDDVNDWKSLVEIADHRMYEAKTNGRARSVGVIGEPLLWSSETTDAPNEITRQQ